MASTVNKVFLLGNVGKDPEIKTTAAGVLVASFSLATQRRTREGSTTQWHNCVTFGKLAEIVEKYVVKGSKLHVEGTLDYSEYEKEGVTRYVTKIMLNDVSLLSSPIDEKPDLKLVEPPLSLKAVPDDGIPF